MSEVPSFDYTALSDAERLALLEDLLCEVLDGKQDHELPAEVGEYDAPVFQAVRAAVLDRWLERMRNGTSPAKALADRFERAHLERLCATL